MAKLQGVDGLFLHLQKTQKFFKHRRGKPLCLSDKLEFLNLWYVTIIINDILTIVGSGYKIQIEGRVGTKENAKKKKKKKKKKQTTEFTSAKLEKNVFFQAFQILESKHNMTCMCYHTFYW